MHISSGIKNDNTNRVVFRKKIRFQGLVFQESKDETGAVGQRRNTGFKFPPPNYV
jgi:hypothetical protein